MVIRFTKTMALFLLISIFKIEYGRPDIKCHTNVNFQNMQKVDDIYNHEPTDCRDVSNICRKFNKLRISFFEMQPFTMKKPRESSNLTSGKWKLFYLLEERLETGFVTIYALLVVKGKGKGSDQGKRGRVIVLNGCRPSIVTKPVLRRFMAILQVCGVKKHTARRG